jgi:pimeloyl-ACP methyl ester carboxylesterase
MAAAKPGMAQTHHDQLERTRYDHDHHEGRPLDLLQGLGQGPASRLQPWLAAERRRIEDQMFFLTSRGYRCIAHDQRGPGRSKDMMMGLPASYFFLHQGTLRD